MHVVNCRRKLSYTAHINAHGMHQVLHIYWPMSPDVTKYREDKKRA